MTNSTDATAVSSEPTPALDGNRNGATPEPQDPLWARLFMPSITDILFIALLCALTFGNWAPQLLGDADIGWHIRNGEHILTTHAVPRVDYFSYSMEGKPWYAWEWLYDVMIGGLHSIAGLNGVVAFSALIIALSLALLFSLALNSSGNLVVAMGLTGLSGIGASIHFLARPHVLTWLFTLVWFQLLRSFQSAERKHLFVLPALMVLWANLHGGFLVGLALLALFLAGNVWTLSTASCSQDRGRAQERAHHLGIVLLLSLGATLVNPYGYRLYTHLYQYLSSKFLMDNIMEFLSPDFHLLQVKAFAGLLLITVLALALGAVKTSAVDLLVIAFSIWVGLYAVRNVPISSILLTLTIAPMLGGAVRDAADRTDIALWLRGLAAKGNSFSARMIAMELRFKTHLLAVMVVVVVALLSVTGHGAPGRRRLSFDEKRMPVKAAEYMAQQNIRDHFVSPDYWSGYLIYRLYPKVQVMFDDRHDFYPEAFLREYLKLMHVSPGWRRLLDLQKVNYVLVPRDAPLASVLSINTDWKVVYLDGTAVIFARTSPIPVKSKSQELHDWFPELTGAEAAPMEIVK